MTMTSQSSSLLDHAYSTLKVQMISSASDGGVWLLTFHRPEALNALNSKVLDELHHFLNEFSRLSFEQARVLVLTGAEGKAFVAGADIKEIHSLNPETARMFSQRGQTIFRQLEQLKVPVIAAVNGFALGGGLELALSCDMIFASQEARFGLPEVTLGLIPGFGGTSRLTRVVGLNRAREMIFSGTMINAAEALSWGLVNHIFERENFMDEVMKIAQTISKRAPLSLTKAKVLCQESHNSDFQNAQTRESEEFGGLFHSLDAKEGTLAFIEKRKPHFSGQ